MSGDLDRLMDLVGAWHARPDERDVLRWPLFVAIWDRIGLFYAADVVYSAATGTTLRDGTTYPASDEFRATCRQFVEGRRSTP